MVFHRLHLENVSRICVSWRLNFAMETGAIDAALIEAPYNVMLERKGFRKILFVGDLIPSPLAGFGTRLEKIHKQPDEIQRLVRATLRGIHLAKSNRQDPYARS